jgi:uncharacterized radical SAM protein YgiQ
MAFLPINKQDMKERNISQLDFIFVSGDAYVDHPSFGAAVITRLIESYGFSVGVVAQPKTEEDYKKLGSPKHAFFIGSGVVDSMVNNYTTNKRKRSDDVYSEGGISGNRPDRALTVYSKNLRKYFGEEATIIIGGIEASLRRFAHYDYWKNEVMPSLLIDSDADLLVYGMGERPIFDMLAMAKRGVPLKNLRNIWGTSYKASFAELSKKMQEELSTQKNYLLIPSFETVISDNVKYVKAFNMQEVNTHYVNAIGLIQKYKNVYVVQNKPAKTLTQKEMDAVYALEYERTYHPSYKLGVPAIKEVEFSITSQRGCYGNCSFCAITYHQGRAIQNRSESSIVDEAKKLIDNPNFKGYIHDIGGPTANFYEPSCEIQEKNGICKTRECIGSKVCPNLKVDHTKYLNILKSVRNLEGIKKVFVRSGVRFDYVMYDKDEQFFNELCKYHISGQLKIAPEHISNNVLKAMNKPEADVYYDFANRFKEKNDRLGKNQFLVPYLISSHPGSTLDDAIKLALYLKSVNYMPLQVQDFYPTPSTKSTCMYYTGLDTKTFKPVYVAKTKEDKLMQRALMQWRKKENYNLIIKALKIAGREDLIGFSEKCLIKPTKEMAIKMKK